MGSLRATSREKKHEIRNSKLFGDDDQTSKLVTTRKLTPEQMDKYLKGELSLDSISGTTEEVNSRLSDEYLRKHPYW